jgi:ABC-2 type transport system ATP-binding protein
VTILETVALTRRFGGVLAVDGVHLAVAQGEIFGLLGPNGAGKTTVLKMLTTLLPPTAGSATVAGFDIRRQPAQVRAAIGYVPQLISVDGALSGYENLLIFSKLYGVPRTCREGRIEEALELAGLVEAAGREVRGYSGGMVRRLELAMAMVHRPRVLFLDEPTVGLDPVARQAVWRQIHTLTSAFGMTIFLTTHFMEEADVLCGRLTILNRGRVAASGSPAELRQSMDQPDATLDMVFAHYTGHTLESEHERNYRDISQNRRNFARLG